MAKPELGTKRMCPSCGTKYYDLQRSPITCPSCGTIFEVAAREKAAPERAIKPAPVEEVEKDEEEEGADVADLLDVDAADEDEVWPAGPCISAGPRIGNPRRAPQARPQGSGP